MPYLMTQREMVFLCKLEHCLSNLTLLLCALFDKRLSSIRMECLKIAKSLGE